jgi:DNA-binding transcriptional LysR family regulator
MRLHAGNWDDLVHPLRSRTLDFFVAETSLLSREPDLEVVALPVRHAVYFVARAGHPLAGTSGHVRAADILAWPFVTPSRIPPRVLDPLLAANREASLRTKSPRPFPAIECNGLEPVKRIVAASDAVTATLLSCIARELDSGEFVVLGTEPWMHLHYGIVSLLGRPWTQTAEAMRELVLEAEQDSTDLGQQLVERHAPQSRSARAARKKSKPRAR